MRALQEVGIIVSLSKSKLYTDEIKFLGHIISSHSIEVDRNKAFNVNDWPVPCNQGDIRSFLGLVNYLAKFIPNLVDYSTVLSCLMKKGVEFVWTDTEQKAFEEIKFLDQDTPICHTIDYNNPDPIYVITDMSNNAIGGYYSQGKDSGTMSPVSFYSRALNTAERNYATHDKEMLAIVTVLKKEVGTHTDRHTI